MELDQGQLPDSTRLRALDPVILVVYLGCRRLSGNKQVFA